MNRSAAFLVSLWYCLNNSKNYFFYYFPPLFHLNTERFDEHELEKKRERELDDINLMAGHGSHDGHNHDHDHGTPAQAKKTEDIGRNEPCSCGSGKKYKKCHGLGK